MCTTYVAFKDSAKERLWVMATMAPWNSFKAPAGERTMMALPLFVGLSRAIYTRCVCMEYVWQGIHHIYGHVRCIYKVLANPIDTMEGAFLVVRIVTHRLWLVTNVVAFWVCRVLD